MSHFINIPDLIQAVGEEPVPQAARPVGYAALIASFHLSIPLPEELFAVGEKDYQRQLGRWQILRPRSYPGDSLQAHLDFAMRNEALDLAVLNALFLVMPQQVIEDWVSSEPTGQHSRRTWFLYEWLRGERLDLQDATAGTYVRILDEKKQFGVRGETVTRHRVRNNLPGTTSFCPLVRRSDTLNGVIGDGLAKEARDVVQKTAPDIMARASAFLLLEDSKASYVIEGERPPQDRIQRWGVAIGEAGQRALTSDEFLRLQRLVIGDARFMHLGLRTEGGFVGKRDRATNAPIPDHISAHPADLADLIDGLIAYADRSERGELDPIISAASIAFGFVFIHPFEDGNGRVHRWLIHHVLARRGFNPPGVIFPVSAVFLKRIDRYREVLESYSLPRLLLTQWETTPTLNVQVLNDTRDLYRFFDATKQAEFLADSVIETVRVTLPNEVDYLHRYDSARQRIEAFVEMPNATFDLMMGFLGQNDGRFSMRAREKEFAALTDEEAEAIEGVYRDVMESQRQ